MKKLVTLMLAAIVTLSFSMVAGAAEEKTEKPVAGKSEKTDKKDAKKTKKDVKKDKKDVKAEAEAKPAAKGKKELSGC